VTELEMITALLRLHPGFFWSTVVAAVGFTFTAGGTVANFRYMREAMVTKKDLKIALLEHAEKLNEDFVTREEFRLYMQQADKPNGRARGAGHGV
jgi:hypothetical protein